MHRSVKNTELKEDEKIEVHIASWTTEMNKDKGLLGKGVRQYVMGECKKEMNAQEILLLLQVKSLPGNKRCLNLQDWWQAVIAG